MSKSFLFDDISIIGDKIDFVKNFDLFYTNDIIAFGFSGKIFLIRFENSFYKTDLDINTIIRILEQNSDFSKGKIRAILSGKGIDIQHPEPIYEGYYGDIIQVFPERKKDSIYSSIKSISNVYDKDFILKIIDSFCLEEKVALLRDPKAPYQKNQDFTYYFLETSGEKIKIFKDE